LLLDSIIFIDLDRWC